MADDSDEEKNEPPTQRRLDKAREEGQVPRSRELTSFLLLVAGLSGLWVFSGWMGGGLMDVMRIGLSLDASLATDTGRMLTHIWGLAVLTLKAIAPWVLLLVLVSLLAPNLLGGFNASAESLKVDFAKLNPIKGIGRQFGSQFLAEMAKAIAKTALVGSVAAWYLYAHLQDILNLALGQGKGTVLQGLRMVMIAGAFMLLSFIVVVLIDVPYQIWSHHKKLRMSKDEIKKEHKETEGDPQLKGKRRQQQQALAQSRMMAQIPDADVVVTNPTHFAVALSYREEAMGAPRVVAKGADHVAANIRALAGEHDVPLLEAPPLARALYRHAELDAEIPVALYTAVAEVLAWVYQLRRYHREGGDQPDMPDGIEVPPELDDSRTVQQT